MKDTESLIALIKEHVNLGEILKGKKRITNAISEEQFSCLFHGVDRKKSARYYKDTDTAYCWVCKEKWDVISFVRKMEGLGFYETLSFLIRVYGIDISKLPDAPEAELKRLKEKSVAKVDNRKLSIEKLKQAILTVRNDVPAGTYDKFVYSYMMLKYLVSDEKFSESFSKFREAVLRVFKNIGAKDVR
jgi:DNA primase